MIGKLFYNIRRGINHFICEYEKSMFLECGSKVHVGRNCTFTYKTIKIGHSVYIGNNSVIQSAHGYITIGNHVMLGPGVNIHGGNHITNKLGVYMDEVKKDFGSDSEIVIEDDVWIGSNAVILSGVTVGRGAVIGAGTIITKSVPRYAVVVGNPGRILSYRFSDEDIIKHESIIDESDS